MPTYEYVCRKCGHEFERFQSMLDQPLKRCPDCKKLGVKRLVGKGAGLIFKGTGFYITDYKKKPTEGKEGGSDSKQAVTASTDSKPSEAKSSETKPAAAKPAAEAKGAPTPAPGKVRKDSAKK